MMDLLNSSFLSLVVYSTLLSACLGNHIYKYEMNLNESGNIINSSQASVLHFNKQSTDDCSNNNSSECFPMSLTKLLNKLERGSIVQLLPGVHLMWPPQHKKRKTLLARSNTTDQFYFGKLNDYLSSVSLRIQLFHPNTLTLISSIQEKISNVTQMSEGRKKSKDGAGVIGLALVFGGFLMILGSAVSAALAGKALLTSIIALVLSAISGLSMLKGDKSTTYEVVSRPVVSHGHSHSSEIQYEHAGHHGYKRSTDLPSSQIIDNLQMAYNKWN